MRLLLVVAIAAAVYLTASLARHLLPGARPYQVDWMHFVFYEAALVLLLVAWGAVRVHRSQQ